MYKAYMINLLPNLTLLFVIVLVYVCVCVCVHCVYYITNINNIQINRYATYEDRKSTKKNCQKEKMLQMELHPGSG